MRVLIFGEYSGRVRDAFRSFGHDAWSVDLLPSERPSQFHIQGDGFEAIRFNHWDALIAHPPCTHLSVSGARWLTDHFVVSQKGKEVRFNPATGAPERGYWHDGATKRAQQAEALAFVAALMNAPIERHAIENPISVISSKIRRPDQIIQPWQFGHPEQKATCLKNLPPLVPTEDVSALMLSLPKEQRERVWRMPPGPERWKERSRTFTGIAAAMADQWLR